VLTDEHQYELLLASMQGMLLSNEELQKLQVGRQRVVGAGGQGSVFATLMRGRLWAVKVSCCGTLATATYMRHSATTLASLLVTL
jgi:hypothetical protein